jgi:hypothetical protein
VNIQAYAARFEDFPLMLAEFFYRAAVSIDESYEEVLCDDSFLSVLSTMLVSLQAVNRRYDSQRAASALTLDFWFSRIAALEVGETEIVDVCQ